MTRRKIQYWVIPPEADAEFGANMENVLETYALPYDSKVPVLCMDEQPVQLTKETRTPIAATKKHAPRMDYEYEQAGTACIFMFTEPLAGWREVAVRKRRTKVDWATEMANLLHGRYADAERVILVCDNFNTHTMGAFYECLPGRQSSRTGATNRVSLHPKTRKLAEHFRERIEFNDSAVHQRSSHRLSAGPRPRDRRKQRQVNWQFTIEDARIKHKTNFTLSQVLRLTKH